MTGSVRRALGSDIPQNLGPKNPVLDWEQKNKQKTPRGNQGQKTWRLILQSGQNPAFRGLLNSGPQNPVL